MDTPPQSHAWFSLFGTHIMEKQRHRTHPVILFHLLECNNDPGAISGDGFALFHRQRTTSYQKQQVIRESISVNFHQSIAPRALHC